MTRVDASVKDYFKQLDKLISDQMVMAQCRILATEKHIVDDIISRLPWVKYTGPMQKLRGYISDQNAHRQASSSPTSIKDIYNDLLLTTSIVSCEGNLPTAQADARKILDDYSARWLVWNRVESIRCRAALECTVAYKKLVEDIARKSDPRDVKSSEAQPMLASIVVPEASSSWKLLASPVEFDKIETSLTQLYQIENSIGGAKAIREAEAVNKLKTIQEATQAAKNQIDAPFNELRSIHLPPLSRRGFLLDWCQRLPGRLAKSHKMLTEVGRDPEAARQISDVIEPNAAEQDKIITAQLARATAPVEEKKCHAIKTLGNA
jgi:hypothetical protein